MNRTLILLLVVVGLGVGAYFVLKENNNTEMVTTVLGADREFAVDSNTVYKVFLADKHGNETVLERKSDHWIYNKDHRARQDAVDNLLQSVHQVQMKFKPPNQEAVDNIVTNLATEGIKVELYGKNGEMLKAYYVGGATNDERGTYMIIEGANQPYVMSLPAWEGNLRFRYNLLGDQWKDRTLFSATPEEVASVSIEYPKQQNKSFRLVVSNSNPELGPFYPLSPKIEGAVRPGAIEGFLTGFRNIQATSFGNRLREKETIISQVPFAIITLVKQSGEEYSLKLFPDHKDASVDPKTGIVTQPTKVEAYFGLTDTGEFMIVQNQAVEDVLWGYSFFY